jgi:hypothetical protein
MTPLEFQALWTRFEPLAKEALFQVLSDTSSNNPAATQPLAPRLQHSAPALRDFLWERRDELLERFGRNPIHIKVLQDFVQSNIQLLPRDLEIVDKRPRWQTTLGNAVSRMPDLFQPRHRCYYVIAYSKPF